MPATGYCSRTVVSDGAGTIPNSAVQHGDRRGQPTTGRDAASSPGARGRRQKRMSGAMMRRDFLAVRSGSLQ